MRYLILLASIFLLLACAPPRSKESYSGGAYAEDSNTRGVMYSRSSQKMAAPGDKGMNIFASAPASAYVEESYEAEAKSFEPTPSSARMVNYTGSIHMQSSEPEALIDTVVQRAVAKGGSVNNRRNGYVSLQIPVPEFKDFFNYILTLGAVTNKNIFASDITEAYSDNAARLLIAESTLARLQQLLAAAKTEPEKLALLKEIQRVSEQIEQGKLTEKELLRKAAFSTINLWANNIPQQPRPIKRNIKAFDWFSELPSDGYSSNKNKALELQVPKDFIIIKDSRHLWSAASALNATFQAFERKNEPQGTPDFWANAMLEFFKHRYNAKLENEENFSMVRLQSYHTEPEICYIVILKQSDKKTLKMAIAKFPNSEVEQKNSEAIKEVLRRAK